MNRTHWSAINYPVLGKHMGCLLDPGTSLRTKSSFQHHEQADKCSTIFRASWDAKGYGYTLNGKFSKEMLQSRKNRSADCSMKSMFIRASLWQHNCLVEKPFTTAKERGTRAMSVFPIWLGSWEGRAYTACAALRKMQAVAEYIRVVRWQDAFRSLKAVIPSCEVRRSRSICWKPNQSTGLRVSGYFLKKLLCTRRYGVGSDYGVLLRTLRGICASARASDLGRQGELPFWKDLRSTEYGITE